MLKVDYRTGKAMHECIVSILDQFQTLAGILSMADIVPTEKKPMKKSGGPAKKDIEEDEGNEIDVDDGALYLLRLVLDVLSEDTEAQDEEEDKENSDE